MPLKRGNQKRSPDQIMKSTSINIMIWEYRMEHKQISTVSRRTLGERLNDLGRATRFCRREREIRRSV